MKMANVCDWIVETAKQNLVYLSGFRLRAKLNLAQGHRKSMCPSYVEKWPDKSQRRVGAKSAACCWVVFVNPSPLSLSVGTKTTSWRWSCSWLLLVLRSKLKLTVVGLVDAAAISTTFFLGFRASISPATHCSRASSSIQT
jgi:hypothetical protein